MSKTYDYWETLDGAGPGWPTLICSWRTCNNETKGHDIELCPTHQQQVYRGAELSDVGLPRKGSGVCVVEPLDGWEHPKPEGGRNFCPDCRDARQERSRHIETMREPRLEDFELHRMKTASPGTHQYITGRRQRGIPAEGAKQWTTSSKQ